MINLINIIYLIIGFILGTISSFLGIMYFAQIMEAKAKKVYVGIAKAKWGKQ